MTDQKDDKATDQSLTVAGINLVVVKCAYCGGSGGKKPGLFSEGWKCRACGGRGVHRVPNPPSKCAWCNGCGYEPGFFSTGLCTACGGAGWV